MGTLRTFAVAAVAVLVLLPGPAAGSPLSAGEHPRIYFSAATLPQLRAKLAGPMLAEFKDFVSDLDKMFTTIVEKRDYKDVAGHYAFLYVIDPATIPGVTAQHTRFEYGDKAREILARAVVESARSFSVCLAYDWLNTYLPTNERQAVAQMLLGGVAPKLTDNPFDDQPMGARASWVAAGLAISGDFTAVGEVNQGNVLAQGRLDAYVTMINGAATSNMVAGNFIAGPDGGWSQGLDYAGKPASAGLLQIAEAWRTANDISKTAMYSGATVFTTFPRWMAYHFLPRGGGRLWRTQAMDAGLTAGSQPALRLAVAQIRGLSAVDSDAASLAQWIMDTQGVDLKYIPDYLYGNFLIGEKVTPRSPADLQLSPTKRFANYGLVMMRSMWTSDWLNGGDSLVALAAPSWSRHGTYFQHHTPSFTIERAGPLVVHSGTETHHGYSQRSWSGNTIIFPDPNAACSEAVDCGGQRRTFGGTVRAVTDFVARSVWDFGGIKRFLPYEPGLADRDFDYVYADVTRAYSGDLVRETGNSAKVRRYTRHFVYLRPATPGAVDQIVVFDRTETVDTVFQKRWLLHPSAEPAIGGTVVPNSPVRSGSGEGKTTYLGDANGSITVTNTAPGSNGRLWLQALLPAQRTVVKVGGPNINGEYGHPNSTKDTAPVSHEFEDPSGVQYPGPNVYLDEKAEYVGRFRVEIIPATPALRDQFLNVLQAGETTSSPAAVAKLSGDGFVGARVGERIVVFGEMERIAYVDERELSMLDGTITVDEAGTYKLIVADLQPGLEYEVTAGNVVRRIASGAGTIAVTIQAGGGQSVRVRATGVSLAPPAAPGGIRIRP